MTKQEYLANAKTRYYLITGKDNGFEIEPFIVEALTPPFETYLQCRGDMVRYYEPLTKAEAEKLIKEGIEVY